jgi:hypothetical protein
MARIFGTINAMNHIRGMMTMAEAQNPGYEFSIRQLDLSNLPDNTYGIEIRGAANRHKPGFADVDFIALTRIAATVIVEVLVDDEDSETHEVYQAGQLLYRAGRQEATGDVYELGQAGVEYVYGHDRERMQDAFLKALAAAGVKHKLQPL